MLGYGRMVVAQKRLRQCEKTMVHPKGQMLGKQEQPACLQTFARFEFCRAALVHF